MAAALFLVYAAVDQWAFRCHRVGRNILLVARDAAFIHRKLHGQLMPDQYVYAVWAGRLVWLAVAVLAWRQWRWYGLGFLILYGWVLGSWVDIVSPWPRHARLLALVRERVESGRAGIEAVFLLPTIERIQDQLRAGARFERVTYGVWFGRAADIVENARKGANPEEQSPGT